MPAAISPAQMTSLAKRTGSWKAITALVPGSLDDATQYAVATAGTAIPNFAAVLSPAGFLTAEVFCAASVNDLALHCSRRWLSRPREDDLIE